MSKKAAQSNWWTQFWNLIKANTSLTIIVVAALLLELSTGVLYYFAQNIIERTVRRLMDQEMNAISLCIRNQMAKVEVTVENMAWVVTDDLADPDSLLRLTYQLVEHNPAIMGSSVSCVPYYFPQEGRLYEPYSVRRSDGTIESMQLGSPHHDYTQMEFYQIPISTGRGHWCEPYWDKDGAKMKITTYSMPVRDSHGKIAAVVVADLSLDWLDHVVNQGRVYSSTKRFLVTGRHNLLAGEQSPLFNAALEQLKQLSDQTDYVVMKGDDGKKKHVHFLNVGGQTDWILINVLDDDAVFGKLRRMRISLLLPLMIGLIFAGFIVYRSSRNLERLRRVNAEKERIGGELRVASMIQQSMLPRNDLHQDDVNICGTQEPAREVGGDLFDFFIRDEKLYFLIGDVSGKGVPSAMLMAVTHALFRSASAHNSNPGHIMQTLNETLCQGNDSNMFVTIFIGVLDLPTGHLRYCNAGHDLPYIIHDSHYSVIDCNPNIPVGVFDDKKFGVQQMEMLPDSTIFLYTDGLAEAMDKDHQQFGMTRIETVLEKCAKDQLNPQQILNIFNERVHQFVGEAEQSDDMTMLAICYTPQLYEYTMSESLILKNDIHEVTRFSSFMESATQKMGIEKTDARKLRLAVEEAVVNVINYAYPVGTEGTVEVRLMSNAHRIKMMIIDSGVAFDPTSKEKVDTTLLAEERQIGGLGILLVRELMDSINYEREDGKNILTLIKNLNSPATPSVTGA